MPGTWWISSGTCRGESWDRSAERSRPARSSSSSPPAAGTTYKISRPSARSQPAPGAEPAGVHHQAVGDLSEALDHAVELTGAHPHPAAVEGGVGAAVDDAPAVGQ